MLARVGGILDRHQFAERKHREQRRKYLEASPYINHPIALAHGLSEEGRVHDAAVIQAALLHDTIEDTETTLEELRARFGRKGAKIVGEGTDDKTLTEAERKRRQGEHARTVPRQQQREKEGHECNTRDLKLERAAQQRAPHHRVAARARLVAVDGADEKRRQEHEAFGRRHEAERLAGAGTEPRGQMRGRHQDEHQSAKPVEFGLTSHRAMSREKTVRQCRSKQRSFGQ